MNETTFLTTLLDNLKDPFLFVDTDHTICYMNKVAIKHYKDGDALLGRSIFDCHNAQSNQIIRDVFEALQAGETERLISENQQRQIYMRAVRDLEGTLLGYYERYEST
jgi:DUF438 domain-containing protein